MQQDPGVFIGKGDRPVYLLPRLANRHGLIAGQPVPARPSHYRFLQRISHVAVCRSSCLM